MELREAFQERDAHACIAAEAYDLAAPVPSSTFDTHLRLATRVLNVPAAMLFLVTEDGIWRRFISHDNVPEVPLQNFESPQLDMLCQLVVHSGAPLTVPDIRCSRVLRDLPPLQELGARSYLGAPIWGRDGRPVGAIFGFDRWPRAWKDCESQALTDVATCVGRELVHTLILDEHEEIYQRTRRYNALREAVTLAFIAPDLGVHERFRELLRTSCEVLGMASAVIAKIDGDRTEMLFRHGPAYDELLGRETPFGKTLASIVVSGQEQICVQDLPASRYHERVGLGGRQPGSFVGIPLICDGVIFGVMEFCCSKPRLAPWSEEELSLLTLISMFACAHLGTFGQINSLQNAEAALFHELNLHERDPLIEFVR
ncbi:MAG: GAF domain-containing protein [Pseudomonadota bacterium]